MKHRKILFVQPEHTTSYWGFQYSLRLYGKKTMHPPLGLITVAAMLPKHWDLRLIDCNIETLTDEDVLWADMVWTGGMGTQVKSMYAVLDRCRALGRKTVIGGPHATGHKPVDRADYLVLNEAEVTLQPFLDDLEKGCPKQVYEDATKPDVTSTPVPRFDLLNVNAYGVMDIQYSRGCPFNCEFCDIIALYGRVPRTKTPAQTVAEFQALYDLGYRGALFLVDDNFIGNKKSVKDMLELLTPWMQKHEYPFFLTTEASINLADDDGLLEAMRLSGFKRVFLGIETPSMEALKETQKFQNTKREMVESVHHMQSFGIECMGGFIVGFDSDEANIFDRQIQFITQAELPWAMVGILAAIPLTQLWDRLQREDRLLGYHSGDQFGGTNFKTKMAPDELMDGYKKILRTIYEPRSYFDRVLAVVKRQVDVGYPNLHKKLTGFAKIGAATIVSMVIQGVFSSYRREYWRFMYQLLTQYRKKYVVGLMNSIVGHHFIKYTDKILKEAEQRTAYAPIKPIDRQHPTYKEVAALTKIVKSAAAASSHS